MGQVTAWLVVVLFALRVEHLWASAFWVEYRIAQWSDAVRNLSPRRRADPARIAQLFAATDGGKLPWLFFGVKSHRIWRWARKADQAGNTVRAMLLYALRTAWVYYILAPAVACCVGLIAITGAGADYKHQLTAMSALLWLGVMALLWEMIGSYSNTEEWRNLYHRWPKPLDGRPRPKTSELKFAIGVVLLVLFPCALASQLVTAVTLEAYGTIPDGITERFGQALLSVVGFAAASGPGSTTPAGWITSFAWVLAGFGFAWFVVPRLR